MRQIPRVSPARFGAYLYSQFCSAFNDNVHAMAIGLYLTKVSGTDEAGAGLWQSIIGAAFVVPFILFSPLAGSVADRFSKRKILILTKWTEVIPMCVSVGASYLPAPASYYGLVLGIFLMEIRAAFFSPAKYGILAEMVSEERLVRANGIVQMLTMIGIVAGEAVGGFALQGLEIHSTLLLCLGISVVGSALAIYIPEGAAGNPAQPLQINPLAGVWKTSRQMRGSRVLILTLFTLSAFWMVSYIFKMNIPVFGKFALHVGPGQTSLLWAFVSIGIGVGAGLAAGIRKSEKSMGLVAPGIAGMAACSAAVGLGAKDFGSSAVLLGVLGVFGGLYLVPQTTIFLARSPDEHRGSYLALQNFTNYAFMLLASGLNAILRKFNVDSGTIFTVVGVGLVVLGAVQTALQPALLLGNTKALFGGWMKTSASSSESSKAVNL